MIFVTVGTHEQPFDRLIKIIDKMVEDKKIKEEVIIQKGYTDYEPMHCTSYKLISYDEMQKYINEARIVITHGGPSSFIMPLQIGKIPIVVPRMEKYKEHVNDHQVEFARAVSERQRNIIVVNDVNSLDYTITNYDDIISSMPTSLKSNNAQFCTNFARIVDEIM